MTPLQEMRQLVDQMPALQAEYDRQNASGTEVPISEFWAAEARLREARKRLQYLLLHHGADLLKVAEAAHEVDENLLDAGDRYTISPKRAEQMNDALKPLVT